MILILFYDFKKYLNVSAVRTLDHHDKMRGQLTFFFQRNQIKNSTGSLQNYSWVKGKVINN